MTDPLASERHFGYDGQGNIRTVRDESGAVTRFDYDAVGRILSVINPVGATTHSPDSGDKTA